MRCTALVLISLCSLSPLMAATTVTLSDTPVAPASSMAVNVGNATANFVNGSCFEAPANGDGISATGWGWWKDGGTFTGAIDTTTKMSGNQSQRIVVTAAPAQLKQTRVDLPQAVLTTKLIAGHNYIIKARMKAGTATARMKLGFVNESWGTHYPTPATTLTTNWAEYSWTFTPSVTTLWRGVTIQFLDAQTYWLDDIIAWDSTDTDADTGFVKQYVDRLKEMKPKMLRLGGLGVNSIPLEEYLFRPWPASYGPQPTETLNINTFMTLCKVTNASPFVCMPPAFTDTASAATQTDLTWDLINNHYADHGNMVDYLGGDSNTTYGARRQADGFNRWDTQFPFIYYEMGNETWGTPDGIWDMHLAVQPANTPFPGAGTDPWVDNYAVYCLKRLTEMKGRPGWRSNMRGGFGGFAADTDNWASYRTKLIPIVKDVADFGTCFMYYGTGDNTRTDEQIYGGLFAKAIWHEREIKAMNAKYQTAAGKNVPVVIYEGNAVWGNYFNGPTDNDRFVYSKEVSLGAAVSLIDNYCAGNKASVTFNNHFAFTGGPWGTVTEEYLRKPSFFALKMMNENLNGSMITATVSGSGTWNDGLTSENNVPYVACYPYKNGNALNIVVVNRHRTQTQSVTINRTMTFGKLISLTGGNINTNNETAENITLQTQTLSGSGTSYTFNAAPFSAYILVATDGLPTYALTVNNGSGDGTYAQGANVAIVADAPPANQIFDRWTINSGSPNIASVTSASTSLTMPAGAATITATYKAAPVNQPPAVAFTTPTNNGILTGSIKISARANDPDTGTSDGSGIQQVVFELVKASAVVATQTDTSAPYDWDPFNSTLYTDGVYSLRARATSTVAAGGTSTTATISVTIANTVPPQPPSAPNAISAVASSASDIAVSWSDTSNNETSFVLERSVDNQNWLEIASLLPDTIAYADSRLAAATLYFYRVKAVNGAGDSAYTDPASAVTFSVDDGGNNGGGGSGPVPPGQGPNDDFDGDGVVNSIDTDDDGDGIDDGVDTEPFTVFAFTVVKMKGSMKFGQENKDGCGISGILPGLPAGFSTDQQAIAINVGGAIATFTLDAKGRAKNANGSFTLKLKTVRNKATKAKEFLGGDAPFSLKLSKGTWSDDWTDEGANPAAAATKAPLTIQVGLTFGGKLYQTSVVTSYSAKAEKSGAFSMATKKK